MTGQLVEQPGVANRVLDITGSLGVGQDAVDRIRTVHNLGSVEGLAMLFEHTVDVLTRSVVPNYAGEESYELAWKDLPRIVKTGQRGEREHKRTLKVDADYGVYAKVVSLGLSSTNAYSGARHTAVLEAPFVAEEGKDPFMLSLKLGSTRYGRGDLGPTLQYPGIWWEFTGKNLVTGEAVPAEKSGLVMQEGAKIMENPSGLTDEKAIIFALGAEAVAKFSPSRLKTQGSEKPAPARPFPPHAAY